jgi:hypothetical protein
MKLSLENALLLMALADDEVEGEAKVRAEQLVDADPHARALVAQMRDPRTRAWLEQSVESQAIRGSADDIAGSVLERLAGHPRHRSRSPARRGALGVVAVLAMAAAIPLIVLARRSLVPGQTSVAARIGSTASPSSSGAVGVELDEIDSPSHDVSVFEIAGATAQLATNSAPPSSVVIWIDDDPGAR